MNMIDILVFVLGLIITFTIFTAALFYENYKNKKMQNKIYK